MFADYTKSLEINHTYTEFSTREIFISQENSGNSKKLDIFRFFKTPSKNRFILHSKITTFFKKLVRLFRNGFDISLYETLSINRKHIKK